MCNRIVGISVLLVGFYCGPWASWVVAQLPPSTVRHIREASVYIENYHKDEYSSGSGFVIARTGDSAVIATNHHVIKPQSRYPGHWKVLVYFHSGTPQEYSVEAEWLGSNLEDDLALLQVERRDLPLPLQLELMNPLAETQKAYVAGFPFGQLLGVGGQKPAITITEGSVSSIRRGAFGEPALIQFSGGIDPGNSGGPVVNKEGKVVAISVAKINQSSIGFGVPGWKLQELRQQIVRNFRVQETPGAGYLACQGEVNLPEGMDGTAATHKHHVMGFRKDASEPMMTNLFRQDGWGQIPAGEAVRCRSSGKSDNQAWTRLTAHLPLENLRGRGDQIVLQWRTTLESGQTLFSRPIVITEEELRNPRAANVANRMNGDEAPESGEGGKPPASAIDGIVGGGASIPTVDERVHQFSARIRRVMTAGDYKYLVVETADGKLHCIDLNTEEIVATRDSLRIDELASGKTEIVGFNRTERTLTRFRLPSLETAGTRQLQGRAAVRYAWRGCKSTGPVAAIIQPSGSDKLACVQVQPSSGRVVRFSIDGEQRVRGRAAPTLFDSMPMSDGFRVRTSDDGTLVTMWLAGSSKVGGHVLTKYRSKWKYDRVEPLAGYLVPGPTGKLLCSAESVYAADLTELHDSPLSIPSSSADYFLTIGKASKPSSNSPGLFTWHVASCSEAAVHRTVLMDGDITDASVSQDDDGFLSFDERFQCLPQWNRLVVVSPGPSTALRLIELGEPLPSVESMRGAAEEPAMDVAEEPALRVWTAASGDYKVEATMLAAKSGYVQLETKDGRKLAVPIAKLSPEDQQYIEMQK